MSGDWNMMEKKVAVLFLFAALGCFLFGYWLGFLRQLEETDAFNNSTEIENLKIGDTAQIHHVEVTLHGARTLRSGEDENKQYVFIDVSIKNMREQAYELNLHKFTLVDRNFYSYDFVLHEEQKGVLGGRIASGRTVRGEIAFYVPIDDEYELIFTDHLRTGQAIWTVKIEGEKYSE